MSQTTDAGWLICRIYYSDSVAIVPVIGYIIT